MNNLEMDIVLAGGSALGKAGRRLWKRSSRAAVVQVDGAAESVPLTAQAMAEARGGAGGIGRRPRLGSTTGVLRLRGEQAQAPFVQDFQGLRIRAERRKLPR